MKINWSLRLKNKTTLTSILVAVIALIYQLCGLAGVVPAVSQSEAVNVVGVIINVLCMLGIVVDPTTAGTSDSTRAMSYTEPSTQK